MRLTWIELLDFRNHERTELRDIADGLITAVGANGEGKSNLLEGMAFLFFLTSPRSSSTEPLVRHGAEAAYARGEVETRDGRVLVEVEIPGRGASRVHVNRKAVRRKRDLRRQVRAVFFAPEDLDIVRGDPGARRRFVDDAVIELWPLKESAITAYDKVVRQRNRLLKEWEGRGAPPELETWNGELVLAGVTLMRLRRAAVEALAPGAEEEFIALSRYGLECRYLPNVDAPRDDELEDAFRRRLAERRSDELVRRTSLVGPHRDDLHLAVRDLRARAFASHGEAWAAAVCLRLGLGNAIAAEVGERPVVLLDDPFSALDPARQGRLSERLPAMGQVVISVADEAHVPPNAQAVWDVAGGAVAIRGGR